MMTALTLHDPTGPALTGSGSNKIEAARALIRQLADPFDRACVAAAIRSDAQERYPMAGGRYLTTTDEEAI